MARLLVLSHDARPFGAQRLLLHLFQEVTERSPHTAEFLFKEGGSLLAEFETLGPCVVLPKFKTSWGRGRFLRSRFVRQDYDLIYCNTLVNGELLAGLPRLPVLTHVHELQEALRLHTRPKSLKTALQKTDHFVAVSSAVVEHLDSLGIPPTHISRIPGFVPECPWPPTDRLGWIVGAGSIEPRKGCDRFVEIAKRVQAAHPFAPQFLWLGAPADESYWKALQRDPQNPVRFVGQVQDPRPYFQKALLLALTSREDPFPLVMLEAASVGTPTLCFESGGGAKEFVPRECVVEEDSIEGFVKKILGFLAQPERLRQLGNASLSRYEKEHRPQRVIPKILRTIDELLEASR